MPEFKIHSNSLRENGVLNRWFTVERLPEKRSFIAGGIEIGGTMVGGRFDTMELAQEYIDTQLALAAAQ